ncbi:MAG TPA: PilZ domain-containing protein [Ramlibacter sp.]|nr:PilZ domain-containing protein [Ramlibacter sp.]
MFVEQRTEPREKLALPLKLGDGCSAVTRDISASGMYLEISGELQLTGTVVFEMYLADAHMKFTAEGDIVRIEHRAGVTGVAVKLRTPRLESTAP